MTAALDELLEEHAIATKGGALWSAFTIYTPSGTIFFAGDTGWGTGAWARAAARRGPYRLAILPVGAYRPREMMRESHINPQEAYRVFEMLNPVRALGVHWGTFQLSFEGPNDPPREIAELNRARHAAPGRFVTTEPGRSFRVPER
ncbi:MAG TPA: MBL fold metallo-hydrolase [Allosphingosinicella sp.]|nr:MBL fold metallo-hydrolase [Allosphingosinicella sp.]